MRLISQKLTSLILPVLILISPMISYAGHGGGQNGNGGNPVGTDPQLPVDTIIDGGLRNNYNADETEQLKLAWAASGRDVNDFAMALNYASRAGMTPDELTSGINNGDPNWTPFTQLQTLQNAWNALGKLPGDFDAGIQAAAASGKTSEQILADFQQQAQDLAKQYQDWVDELTKYTTIYDEVAAAMANGDPIDWADIANRLGMDPSTPDDIWSRLQLLNTTARGELNELDNNSRTQSMTPAQRMNYLLRNTPDGYGQYCSGDCQEVTRPKIDAILRAPGQNPPDNGNGDNGGNKEPLVSDNSDMGKTLLDNLRLQLPSLVRLVFALSYTIGVVFCIIGMIKLKHIGESRGANNTSTGGLFSVMAYMITGTVLIYLPSNLNMATGTFFVTGDSSLFAYSNDAIAGMSFENLIAVVVDIVKLVGLIAFVRGWIMLSKIGSQSSHGTMGKSMVHIIAGILAVNIMTTWEVARATFGYAW